MNWLDRTIAWLSPTRGATRAQARVAIDSLLSYEGAKTGRRTDGWSTGGGSSANAEIGASHESLRDRARDLVRNNPHAAKGISVIVANKIGTGIICGAAGKIARANKRIDAAFERWVYECDLEGRLDLYGIQSLAERTRAESGEALIRLYRPEPRDEKDVPLRLRVLEPDFIDSSKSGTTESGNEVRLGVEYANEVPVAYWLFESHPGGNDANLYSRRGNQSRRVVARDVIHYFKSTRPGQSRGVTDLAPVIMRLREVADYDDAELMRKKIAACTVGIITAPAGLPGASLSPTSIGSDGKRLQSFGPGMFHYTKPGEGVVFNDPKPSSDYEAFIKVQLRAIAAGLSMPYELLTGDLSEVNYTSHRGGLVQFRAMVEADQWQVVIPQICRPIWQAFMGAYAIQDRIADPSTPAVYTPPRFGLLDPSKEIPAMVQALQAGIESYPNAIRREGYDWREKLDETKEAIEYAREIGVEGLLAFPPPKPAPAAPPDPNDKEDDDAAAA